MYIFKLFELDDAEQAVDARLLQDGTLRIGRDPTADWVMHDPGREISRWHCEFRAGADGLTLRCIGANGVFDDNTNVRMPEDTDITVVLPTTLRLGPYRLVADFAAQARLASTGEGQTLILSPPLGNSAAVPTDWSDAPAPVERSGEGSLLEAFCQGAGLDASAFSSEAPEEIMRRAGAVYRQMVLGVGDLMSERERARRHYQLARTTIGGTNNNPFKWAPTQRLALDLLLAGEHGFLTGPEALTASFCDIKKHLIATFSAFRETMRAAVQAFDPAAIDADTRNRSSLLKGRGAIQWEEARRRYAELSREIAGEGDGSLNHAFVKAYEEAAADLEGQTE